MKVAVIGSGMVGETLANAFIDEGHEVMRASRDPSKLRGWVDTRGGSASAGTFDVAAKFGDVVVLAVKGSAAESAVNLCGPEHLAGKPVLDATNPIGDGAPTDGVVDFFTDLKSSLMERLQELAPKAHFVKAFSCVGNAHMYKPNFDGQKPTMFICGNDAGAKTTTTEILHAFGWEVADMGAAAAARAIEPLCMLWCIPGFKDNSWNHAFKLLKK